MSKLKMSSAVVAIALLGAAAGAEEKSAKPQGPATPLRLQVVLSRYQGEKKVSSFPYTLPLSADDNPARVQMGIMVPLKYEGPEVSGNVVFKDVGNSADCHAAGLGDGRFRLACMIQQTSVDTSGGERKDVGAPMPPVLRSFRSEAALVLGDGQTAQYTAAADPVSGETLRVDVTLNVVR